MWGRRGLPAPSPRCSTSRVPCGTTSTVAMPSALRHHQVARQVLEHRRPRRLDPGHARRSGRRSARFGLGSSSERDDVEDFLEMVGDAEPLGDLLGMGARAVGQDELAPRQRARSPPPAAGRARPPNGRCRGRIRGSRRARCRAPPSARAASCRSAGNSPSAPAAPPPVELESSRPTYSRMRLSTCWKRFVWRG